MSSNYPPSNPTGRPTDANLSNYGRTPEPTRINPPSVYASGNGLPSAGDLSSFKTFDPGSAVPYSTPGISDDIISKLRFAEEQLQNERRSRSWLETELQLGKSLVATLSAKVEKMQESIANDSQTIKDLVRQNEQNEKRAMQSNQDLLARLEREQAKTQNFIADLSARLKVNEQREEEESERQKMVVNELNDLRYKVEAFSLRTSEVGQEFRAKARDWELEAHRGMDVMRVLREHQIALDGLQQALGSLTESISKKVEMSVLELRQKVDQEARARFMFEGGMRDLFNEVKRAISTQDRELHDRIEGMRNQILLGIDRERQDREKTVIAVVEQMRSLERTMRDAQQMAIDKVNSQMAIIEDQFAQEKAARAKFESQCKTDVQDGFKEVQDMVDKNAAELQESQADLKHHVASVVKALKDSVLLVEKTADQKQSALEEVLRAEIKARNETERALNEFKSLTDTQISTVERRAMEAIGEVIEETKITSEKLEESIKTAAEQVSKSKTRMIEDFEKQLSQMRGRIKEFDTELGSKFRQAQLASEQVGRDAQEKLEMAEAKIDGKLGSLFVNNDELASRIREVETRCDLVKTEVEDKMNIRTLQVDAAFEAVKAELDLRASKKDAADMETRFEASLANVQTSVSRLTESHTLLRDEVEMRATRKEMDDIESKIRQLVASVQTRISETETQLISVKEDVSDRSLKKEIEELESRTKASILDLQIRDAELDNQIDRVREDISTRVSREQMIVIEERLKDQLQTADIRREELVQAVSEMKNALALRATKIELDEVGAKVTAVAKDLDEKVADCQASVLVAKGDITKAVGEDFQEMVGKINKALDEIQAKIETCEGSMEVLKVRVSDVDMSGRSRLQQIADHVQNLVTEQATVVAGVKDLTSQKLQDFHAKFEEIPLKLAEAERLYDEFRKKLTELNRTDTEKMQQLLADMRETLTQKVSEQEFDRMQTEFRSQLQRLQTQLEMEQVAAEQARLRVQEVDLQAKDRCREIKTAQERALEEHLISIRLMKETLSKRLEEMDARISTIPKSLEQAWMEIRKLHNEVDDRLRSDIMKVERDLTVMKGELTSRVTEKSMELSVKDALGPLILRIERLNRDLDEVKFLTERTRSDVKTQLADLQKSASVAPGPSVLTSDRQPMQFGSIPPVKRNDDPYGNDTVRNQPPFSYSSQPQQPPQQTEPGRTSYYKPDFNRGAPSLATIRFDSPSLTL
ncbi:hypothetical protein HDU96_007182 [Phlyctochytrium bullatum]|nr:hypothetical protein HDU96_007182 [Phlyctochytrium bullatum]